MRKMIRDACDSDRPWIEAAWELAQNGVPHNLIMWESNEYGKSKLLQTKP